MTYVIAQPCVDLKDRACVEECPVDCIYEGKRMLYIHPDECVDCGACEPVCPVEAIFYEDDTPEMRELRLLQANLVGPAGYISMEDTEATELVQRGTVRDGDKHSYIAMAREAPDQQDTVITENLIRRFWVGYQKLMGY